MVPYLSWLERAAHDRVVLGSNPSGTTSSVGERCDLLVSLWRARAVTGGTGLSLAREQLRWGGCY